MHEIIVGVKNRIPLMENQFMYFLKWKWDLMDREAKQVQSMGSQRVRHG